MVQLGTGPGVNKTSENFDIEFADVEEDDDKDDKYDGFLLIPL